MGARDSTSARKFASKSHRPRPHRNGLPKACTVQKGRAVENRDVMMLDADEKRLLDLSFQPGLSEKRLRNILINLFLAATALLLFASYGIGLIWLTAMAATILVVSAVEKVSYVRTMLHYKSLVRKLVHRMEELEGSAPTAMGSHPAHRVERQLQLDHAREQHATP